MVSVARGDDGNEDMYQHIQHITSAPEEARTHEMDHVGRLIRLRHAPLPSDEETNAAKIVNGPQTQDVIAETPNCTIRINSYSLTRKDIACLRPDIWLNDEVVNFYMWMLDERDRLLCMENSYRRRSHFFNSFFMAKLGFGKNINTENVKRWTKNFKPFTMDKIFFPINIENQHWTMLVVNIKSRRILYFDSLYGDGLRYCEAIQFWLNELEMEEGWLQEQYEFRSHGRDSGTPCQTDGTSCGVFSLLCADFMSDDLPINESSYNQSQIDFFRTKIAAAILRGRLDYEPIRRYFELDGSP
jgi:sentrin-specific protease 1